MSQLFYAPRVRFTDANGDPLAGGKLYFFKAGTSTPKDTYSAPDLSVKNANPVILDARGEAIVYGSGKYKVKVYSSTDVLVYEKDDYSFGANNDLWGAPIAATYVNATSFTVEDAANFHVGRRLKTSEGAYGVITNVSGTTITVEISSGSLTASLASVQLGPAADSTSASVQYYPLKSGETGVVNYVFSETNVLRFIPYSLHSGMRDGTNTEDLSSYIQNAINSSNEVYLPGGYIYLIDSKVTLNTNSVLIIDGELKAGTKLTTEMVRISSEDNCTITGQGSINVNFIGRNPSAPTIFDIYREKAVAIYIDASTNIKIKNLKIDGNRQGNDPDPNNWALIYGYDSSNVICAAVDIVNSPLGGIYFNGGDECAVYMCSFESINGSAVGTTWRSVLTDSSTLDATNIGARHRFVCNLIDGCSETGISCNSKYSVVANNISRNGLLSGITIGHDSTANNSAADYCVVVGNVCDNNSLDGISISNAPFISAIGNVCENNGRNGIYIQFQNTSTNGTTEHASIIGNVCKGNVRGIANTDKVGKGLILKGNTLTGNTTGLSLLHRAAGDDEHIIDGNNISENVTGINLSSMTKLVISNNRIRDNSGTGWVESGGGGHVVNNNDIGGNVTDKEYLSSPTPSYTTFPKNSAGLSTIWVDSTGILRIHTTAPTSDTDGVVVGTQT